MSLRLGLGLLALLATLAPPPGAIDDPEARIAHDLAVDSTTVSPLEVKIGGPAWWEVSRGGRVVYVLGVLWDYPEDEEWSQVRLKMRLSRAGGLLTPPSLDRQADSAPVGPSPSIPDEYRSRLTAAAKIVGEPADRYLTLSPLLAGYVLARDYRRTLHLQSGAVARQVVKLSPVNQTPAGRLRAPAMLSTAPTASRAAQLECLNLALTEVEAGPEPFERADLAWAEGDVLRALEQPRAADLCAFAIPEEAEVRRLAILLQASSIETALKGLRQPIAGLTMNDSGNLMSGGPPRLVAVVGLRSLVAQDGVLDRLKAAGYHVTSPPGLSPP